MKELDAVLHRLQGVLNLVAAGMVAAFIALVAPQLVNSDSASTLLLARQIIASGNWLLSPEWYYVSDSFSTDGRLQLTLLAVLATGGGMAAFVLMACLGALALALACVALSRTLGASLASAITASLVLLLGPSLIYQDVVIALNVSIQMALTLLLVLAFVKFNFKGGSALWLVIAVGIVLMMSVASPKKAVAYLVFPSLATILGVLVLRMLVLRGTRRETARLLGSALATIMIAALGYYWHSSLLESLLMDASYAKVTPGFDSTRISANLGLVWDLLAKFAGHDGSMSGRITSIAWLLAFTGMFSLPILLSPNRREFLQSERGFAYLFAVAGAGGILVYLATTQRIMQYYGVYYLFIPLVSLLPVAASTNRAHTRCLAWATNGLLSLLMLLGCVATVDVIDEFPKDYKSFARTQSTTHQQRLGMLQWLRDMRLKRGYATFWDANSVGLLSAGEIEVTPIKLSRSGKMFRFRWLTDTTRAEYLPRYGERWFIAIPAIRRRARLPDACLPADLERQVSGYRMYVYDDVRPGCLPRAKSIGPARLGVRG
jgi:hypothetical protein